MRDVFYNIDRKMEEDIPFGAYKPRTDSPILSLVSELHVSLIACQTLKGEDWIDGSAIDVYIMRWDINWHDICYMPTYYTRSLFGFNDENVPKEFRMYDVHLPVSDKILMPYMFNSHRFILLISFDRYSVILIDPIRVTKKRSCTFKVEENKVIRNFENFISECPQTCSFYGLHITWKREQWINRKPFQTDGYNCRAFISYYVQCIESNTAMEVSFNPANFRRKMAEYLLKKSEDTKGNCDHYFVVNPNIDGNVVAMCTFYRQFAHNSWIPGKKKTIAECASDSIQNIYVYPLQGTTKELDETSSSYETY